MKGKNKILSVVELPIMPDNFVGEAQHYYPNDFWKTVFKKNKPGKNLFLRFIDEDELKTPDDTLSMNSIIGIIKKYDKKNIGKELTVYVLDTPCGRVFNKLLCEGHYIEIRPFGVGNSLPASIVNHPFMCTTVAHDFNGGVVDVDDYELISLYPVVVYSYERIKKEIENEANCN